MDLPFAEDRFVIHVAVVFTKTTAYVLRNNNVFKFLSNFNFVEWMLPVHCRVVSGWDSRENLQKPGLLWKYLCTWKLNMYDYSWLRIWLILVKRIHAMENDKEISFTQFPKLVMKKQ